MAKKVIKISTLEDRFRSLHYLTGNAEELINAMMWHAQKLDDMEPTDEQSLAITLMNQNVEEWNDDFAKLASEMQSVEGRYFDHLKDGGEKVELIEDIPSCASDIVSNLSHEMTLCEQLYTIGYVTMEDGTDPYGVKDRVINKEVVLDDLKILYQEVNDFLYALGTVEFTGIWERVGELARKVIDNQPKDTIEMFFGLYGIYVK